MTNKTKQRRIFMAIGALILIALFLEISPSRAESAEVNVSQSVKDCFISKEQNVVEWSFYYYEYCQYAWNGNCLWPIRRKHFTYKVTLLNESVPLRNHNEKVIASTSGKMQQWSTFDAEEWNFIKFSPFEFAKYPDHESIAKNEYVVGVTTRYKWFNDVEATLGICVQQPQ